MGKLAFQGQFTIRSRFSGGLEVSDASVIERLLVDFRGSDESSEPGEASSVPIHAIYQGVRTEAIFAPATHQVTINQSDLWGAEAGNGRKRQLRSLSFARRTPRKS